LSIGDPSTLFRTDSMATKTMRNYFHLISRKSYLKRHILPLIQQVSKQIDAGESFEVFPHMIATGKTVEEGIHTLWSSTQKFTTGILEDFDSIPGNMKRFFGILGEMLRKTYGNLPVTPAGSLFFLRFICPAIVFPAEFGVITEAPDPNVYRGLLLVGKVLQGLASRRPFHEEAMIPFSDLVTHFDAKMDLFLNSLCASKNAQGEAKSLGPVDDPRSPYNKEDLGKLLAIIVRKMHINFEAMTKQMLTITAQSKKCQTTISQLQDIFNDSE